MLSRACVAQIRKIFLKLQAEAKYLKKSMGGIWNDNESLHRYFNWRSNVAKAMPEMNSPQLNGLMQHPAAHNPSTNPTKWEAFFGEKHTDAFEIVLQEEDTLADVQELQVNDLVKALQTLYETLDLMHPLPSPTAINEISNDDSASYGGSHKRDHECMRDRHRNPVIHASILTRIVSCLTSTPTP